jgi:tetratricopeptide (TPR) repeat protein
VELQGPRFRLYTWQATLQMILTHPLGVGAGSWRRALPQEAGNLAPEYPFSSSRLPQSAGNEYLETAAELGAAGLLLFLWLLARLISSGMKTGSPSGGIGRGALASIVSLAACGLLASPLREQPTLWAATLLAALAVASRPEGKPAAPRELAWEIVQRRKLWVTLSAALLFAALLGVGGWSSYRSYVSSTALQKGQNACLRKDYITAIPALLRASEMEGSSSLVHYLTGACALVAGRSDLAETELRAAQSLNPQDAATLLALASSLQAKGRLLDAVGVCEKARKIWPRDEAVNLALGDLRNASGDFEGSLEAYRTALKGNPYSVKAYLKMGSLMEASSKMNGAVGSFSRAANLDPYLPEALARLGSAYMKQGNYNAALPAFSAILDMNPDDVPALVNMARLLSGLQRPCDAVPLLEKARDLDPIPSHRAQLDRALPDLTERCRKSRPSPR